MRNQTVVLLSHEDWANWRKSRHMAQLLAEDNRVVFVQPSMRYETLRWYGLGQHEYLRRIVRQQVTRVSDQLTVLSSPPMLPWEIPLVSRRHHDAVAFTALRLSKHVQTALLKRHFRRTGLQPTVSFVFHPFDLLVAGRLGESVSCWRVYDEVSHLPGNDGFIGRLINMIETRYVSRADLVFASSKSQYDKRVALHPSVHFIPNAVSFEMFRRAAESNVPEPEDLRGIPRPRIVYLGVMDRAIDFVLLRTVAQARPDWSLVVVGWKRATGGKEELLAGLPNVHWLGRKEHTEVPHYLKECDVGIIPWLHTPDKLAAYPLKLHEYLALGLPVVSTCVPEVMPYSHVIGVAANPSQFVAKITEALTANSRDLVAARIGIARENSYERRLAQMSELILPRLAQAHTTSVADTC